MIVFTFGDLFCKLWKWALFCKADYYSKAGNWGLSRKHDNDSNSGYVRKWKTGHCLENGQGFWYKKNSLHNFDARK